MNKAGFTILELIVTLGISAVVAAIAVPNFEEIQNSYHRFNSRSYLIQDLRRAQAYALSEGCRGILIIASDKKSYSFGCDYLTYDTNIPPQPDSVNFSRDLPRGITINSSSTVIYNSRGESVDYDGVVSSANLSLIDSRSQSPFVFAQGTLMGTGLFSFE